MKILTKKWREQYEQVRVIHWLKEVDEQKISYDEIQKKSRDLFNNRLITEVFPSPQLLTMPIEQLSSEEKDCFTSA